MTTLIQNSKSKILNLKIQLGCGGGYGIGAVAVVNCDNKGPQARIVILGFWD